MTHIAFIDEQHFIVSTLVIWDVGLGENCLSILSFNVFVVLEDGVWEET